MSGAHIGFFGKLPSHGDFLQRHVRPVFVETWDAWLQRCMAVSRERLNEHWKETYLTSPVWRFVLCEGVVKAGTFTGILAPSVDRVGRYFPFTVVAELPTDQSPMAVTIQARRWFKTLETLALRAQENPELQLDDLDAALQDSDGELAGLESHLSITLSPAFPTGCPFWRLPVHSSDRIAATLIDPLTAVISRALEPMSLWWTEGSAHVEPSCLFARALPDPERFVAMLDGRWEEAGWAGEYGDLDHEPQASQASSDTIVSRTDEPDGSNVA